MKVILSKLNLEKSIAIIRSRNIFRSVKYEVSDGSKSNLKNVDITVEEQPTGEISAGACGTTGILQLELRKIIG